MIPKIVHYCWLSGAPLDPLSRRCFESWRRYLGDFDFRLWDRNNVPKGVPFLDRMLAHGDWAYAADYLRLHALDSIGGIYLDLDLEVFQSFGPLLTERAFLGYEDAAPARLGCHIIGAEPKHPLIRECLEFYRRSWRLRWSYPPTMPRIVTAVARRHFGYTSHRPEGEVIRDGIRLCPVRYFTPVSYRERHLTESERRSRVAADTYALHHWNHAWDWLDRPFREAIPRIPWLFMDLWDWQFVLRRLLRQRLTPGPRE